MENKRKHLELIQAVICRMANHSFLLKGWAVTLVVALFAVFADKLDRNYVLVSFVPVLVFWALDGYFLYQERLFRALYDHVRLTDESKIDFSMNVGAYGKHTSWLAAISSSTLVLFYGALSAVMLVVMFIIDR
jgi:hypothetical protein